MNRPTENHQAVCAVLKALERAKIPDSVAGMRAGCSGMTITHWRRGHSPQLSNLAAVAAVVGLKVVAVRKSKA